MVLRSLIVLALCSLARAQSTNSSNTTAQVPTNAAAQQAIMGRVTMEQTMANMYLELILKLQHGQTNMMAASFYSQIWMAQNQNSFPSMTSYLETESVVQKKPIAKKPMAKVAKKAKKSKSAKKLEEVYGSSDFSDSFDSDFPRSSRASIPPLSSDDSVGGYGFSDYLSDAFSDAYSDAYSDGYPDYSDFYSDAFSDVYSDGFGYDDVWSDGFSDDYGDNLANVDGHFSDEDFVAEPPQNELLKYELIASYYMFQATTLKNYQLIFSAGEVQREFFFDRMLAMSLGGITGSLGGPSALPPQLLQLLYLKTYTTFLKTLRLSFGFQMVSHFRSWLEDCLDVYGTYVSGSTLRDDVYRDGEDDLHRGKMYAFSAYNTYAIMDFQVFFLEYYIQSVMMQLMGAQSPMIYAQLLKLYHVMFQMYAAQGGLFSASTAQQAYMILHDDDPSNDMDANQLMETSRNMFGWGFARNLMIASQVEIFSGFMTMYAMYAPMMGGGGSI